MFGARGGHIIFVSHLPRGIWETIIMGRGLAEPTLRTAFAARAKIVCSALRATAVTMVPVPSAAAFSRVAAAASASALYATVLIAKYLDVNKLCYVLELISRLESSSTRMKTKAGIGTNGLQ